MKFLKYKMLNEEFGNIVTIELFVPVFSMVYIKQLLKSTVLKLDALFIAKSAGFSP